MRVEDFITSADTVVMQSGGKSYLEKMGDAATAGTAGAVVSAWASIYNTGVSVANVFGAGAEEMNTAVTLGEVNSNWKTYYEENKDVIDTVGFIGGAFLPGGLALKGLTAVRAGKSFGTFGNVLRYTQDQQAKYLKAALGEIAQEGGTIFSRINTKKLASMAYGVADQALQAAVFETAAAATMHASPFFEGDSWGDISWDIVKGAAFGGVLGGGVEALFANRLYKNIGQQIDKGQRKYDTVVALDRMGMTYGDETFNLLDELDNLPLAVTAADRTVTVPIKLGKKSYGNALLDVGPLYDRKLEETANRAILEVEKKLRTITKSDPTVGSAMIADMMDTIKQGRIAGADKGTIRETLGTKLLGLQDVTGLGNTKQAAFQEVRYLAPDAVIKDPEGKVLEFLSTEKKGTSDRAYRIAGDVNDAKVSVIGVEFANATAAWEAGVDVAIEAGGKVRINPNSDIFRAVKAGEDNPVTTIYNTQTKTMHDTAIPTIADIATAKKPLQVVTNTVEAGGRKFTFNPAKFNPEADSVETTARHLWAASLIRDKKVLSNLTIDARDFSLLDAIAADRSIVGDGVKFRRTDGIEVTMAEIGDYNAWLVNKKLETAIAELNKSGEGKASIERAIAAGEQPTTAMVKIAADVDMRELALKINADTKWIFDAVAQEFRNVDLRLPSASRPLESYAARENLLFTYDRKIKDMLDKGDFPDAIVAYNERKVVALQKAQEASAAVLRGDYALFYDLNPAQVSRKFESTGVGAEGFKFSNADYGDIPRLWAQDVGKQVSLVSARRVDATLSKLQPYAAAVAVDPRAGAELAAITTRVRRSGEQLALLVDSKGTVRVVDLESKQAARKLAATDPEAALKYSYKVDIPMSKPTGEFLIAHQDLHGRQLADRKILANSQGTPVHWDEEALYVPPIDTRQFPYFAFVRQKPNTAFGTSEVAMITARDSTQLQKLAANIPSEYQVIFKADTEAYFKAKGDFDFSRALNAPTIDPFLRKQGKLGDFLPNLDSKQIMEEYVTYHTRKETQIVRDSIEVKYGQTFAELDWLSKQNTQEATSKFSFVGKREARTIIDPFGDYKKTALNISKRAEYSLWQEMNEFVDALGTGAGRVAGAALADAKSGKITWEEANKLTNDVGLGTSVFTPESFAVSQIPAERNLIRNAVAKGNQFLATVGLRLDMANAVLNTISTPIMLGAELSSIRSAIRGDSELAGKLRELTSVIDPVSKVPVPSTSKLMFNAARAIWTPEGKALLNGRFKDIGVVKDIVSQHRNMIEDLAIIPNMNPKEWAKKVDAAIEKGATWTGNNYAEDFTRFVSAHTMMQLTDPLVVAGKMSIKEQNAYMSIFTNRVQGNYVASQRPIAFQGTIGAAIGLFQTYQFNLLQQLMRHIQNKDARAIGTMAGLQTGMFGLNGLPFFDAVNTQLIGQANINQGHNDAYTFAVQAAGKEAGDWLLYGTASAFPMFSEKMPSLYTRGDLNPRHASIIPTTPAQVPVVEVGSRVIGNLLNMAKMIGNDAGIGATLLSGLEHNGVSRPLAGIAQVLQGAATTSKGSLIASTSDYSAISTMARVVGARPMDESVTLAAKYRLEGYKAADRARIEALGTAVKTKIRNDTLMPEDINELQGRYAALGGRADSFGAAMQRWSKGANQSILNTMADAQQNSYGRSMNIIMGADRLPEEEN